MSKDDKEFPVGYEIQEHQSQSIKNLQDTPGSSQTLYILKKIKPIACKLYVAEEFSVDFFLSCLFRAAHMAYGGS